MTRKFLTSTTLGLILALPACASSGPETPAPQDAAAPVQTSQPTAPQSTPAPTPATPPAQELSQQERFEQWKLNFIAEAAAKGYDETFVRELIMPAQLSERAIVKNDKQPEFTKPIWSYVDSAASADRLNRGRNKLYETTATYDEVENRYRVSRHYLTAIWGLETSYGTIMGNHDIVGALASFAFEGRRQQFGTNQLYALMDILQRGEVREDQLVGSWAGAMGMTQFIPTTFRDYAVDFDGNGNKDLWASPGDALGSAAHYLSRHGWQWGEPAMTEVKLPDNFDYSLADGTKKTVNDWTVLGVAPIGGERWSREAGLLNAKLLVPAGHKGPKFLTFKNFDVIKKYNNSNSYAMGITVLAETLQGKRVITTPWPKGDEPLSLTDKKDLQARLTTLGYDTKGVDGMIGPNSIRAIRAWQRANGYVADGYVEQRLFQKIMGR